MHYGQKMVQDSSAIPTMSESEGRKWSKPIMEKRRRERINKSLEELKRLVLEAQNRDSSRYTKLEKADILEMTVKHLRSLRNRQKSITSGRLRNQTVLPGVHIGCCRCIPEVDPSVTQNDIVMETCRTQPLSRHPGIVTNFDQNGVTIKYESNQSRSDPGHLRVSPPRTCNPAHCNTAVQFIPVCSSELANVMLPGSDSNRVFWRPF